MIRYTYVCEQDHSGWEVEDEGPEIVMPHMVNDVRARCHMCGRLGKLRGVHGVQPLRDVGSAT